MKTKLFVVLLAVFAASACAQSAQMMDSIISSAKLTYGQAAYLILTATEQIDDTVAFSDAFRTLKESGLIKAAALPTTDEAAIPLKNYAFLVMKAFGIHGGMHYRIVPSPPLCLPRFMLLCSDSGNGRSG